MLQLKQPNPCRKYIAGGDLVEDAGHQIMSFVVMEVHNGSSYVYESIQLKQESSENPQKAFDNLCQEISQHFNCKLYKETK